MDIDPDLLDDDLSSAMGSETPCSPRYGARGLPASSKEPAERLFR
jgi:hypothetical protein